MSIPICVHCRVREGFWLWRRFDGVDERVCFKCAQDRAAKQGSGRARESVQARNARGFKSWTWIEKP